MYYTITRFDSSLYEKKYYFTGLLFKQFRDQYTVLIIAL